MREEKLTGNYYHRKTWVGLVLMVEVEVKRPVDISHTPFKEYRKATELDLKNLNLKTSC